MPEEDPKKAAEEAERKFEERVNTRVAREAAQIRTETEARYQAELAAERAENKRLKEAAAARHQAEEEAAKQRLEDLKASVDPALVALLPEKLSVPDQLEWLEKNGKEMPAAPKATMPLTPKGKVTPKQFEPYDEIKGLF